LKAITILVSSRYLPLIQLYFLAAILNRMFHGLQISSRDGTRKGKEMLSRDAFQAGHGKGTDKIKYTPLVLIIEPPDLLNDFLFHCHIKHG
jgi:hypothetical protein